MRPEKISMVEEIRRKVSESAYVILADYRGLSVSKADDLRKRLRGANAKLQVVPNRIFRHVARDLKYKGFDAVMGSPSAMVVGQGDVVQVAKVLKDFIKENDKPVIKLGALQGAMLTSADVQRLADLPSRDVLLAMVLGTLVAPMRQLAGVLQQKTATILYVLKAIQEKKAKA